MSAATTMEPRPDLKAHRPPQFDPGPIPAELKARPQWVVWRWETRDGKTTKVLYRSNRPRTKARTNTPDTWSTFDQTLAAYLDPRNGLDGIGFVFSVDDPFAGVDLDNCLDEDGSVRDWARPVLDQLRSYAEVSPSGRGVKLFLRGSLPENGRGRRRNKVGPDGTGAIELYTRGRYFTLTGRPLDDSHAEITDQAAGLLALHAEWFPPKAKPERIAPSGPNMLGDAELIAKARAAKNGKGESFSALFDGSTEGYGSQSEADLALCSALAFWTGGDVDAIDRLFRQSGLYRDKWAERPEYRAETIAKACNRSTSYDPTYRSNGAPPPPPGGAGEGGQGEPDGPRPNEAKDDPHRLARIFIDELKHVEGQTLFYWREDFHQWDGTHYRICPDKEIRAELTTSVKSEFDRLNLVAVRMHTDADKPPPVVRPVTTAVIANVSLGLTGVALLRAVDCPEQPAWLCDDPPFPASEVLPCRNALVHLTGAASGLPPARCLARPTPAFFGAYSLDFDYRPNAPAPLVWLKFLADLWQDDRQSIEALQEWFGYSLAADTSQQKMLMLIGPKRSGKGTIGRTLTALLGPSNVATPTLTGLSSQFGAACLIGKTAAIFGDARIGGRHDIAVAIERILSITGEDLQTIQRKNRDDWDGRLKTRFTLISNELPKMSDVSGALPSRMIVLRLTESFLGREDKGLQAKIDQELPGILLWAIAGWKRLRDRGHFIQPESASDLVEQMEDLSSPVSEFVKDVCVLGPVNEIFTQDLYQSWKDWCQAQGKDHPGERPIFGRNLTAAFHGIRTSPPTTRPGRKGRLYLGIDLSPAEKARKQAEKAKPNFDVF